MRVITGKPLIDFYEKHDQAAEPLKAWWKEAKDSVWKSPHDVKKMYKTADIIKNNRVVFNIGGNKYRLVVEINYKGGMVFIKFVGTHREYDKINASKINGY